MLYGAEVAVCSEINTKHMNTVWVDYQFSVLNLLVHATNSLSLHL
jgi:hypothetical protein